MQSYLYRMAQQLQWAFDTLETGDHAGGQRISQDGKVTPAQKHAFAGIKDLIIKSADIVNAYYAVIAKRLEGVYVAQSDFGAYREETALDIQANSSGINQLYANIREISGTVEELYNNVIGTNAYLKSGLLYEAEDGSPVYGLEIGQTNSVNGSTVFDKFARFTADRLSFFDRNDVEVAYISDYKLYITHAEVTGSLTIAGRFKIYYNNGLAFQWMGGN